MRVLRIAARLACLSVLAAMAAAPAAGLAVPGASAAMAPVGDAIRLEPASEGPDALSAQVAGQGVAVPLPAGLPVEVAVALPVSGVGLALGEGGEAAPAAAPGGHAPQTAPSDGMGLEDVPPAAVAVAGTGLLAVLVGAACMGLFSRIEGPAVLEHPTRARLMGLVAERPGLTILQAQERLGAAWGTTVHHVRRLEANGLVATVRQGPRVLLYAANTPEAKARRDLALLRNDTAREVARLVAGTPGIRTGVLSATLGIGAPSASKHLSRFAAAGLVEHPQAGGFVATERLHQALSLV